MKTKIVLVSFLIPVFVLVFSLSTTAKNESSCINCHTNEAVLQPLCKAPPLPAAEGEG